LKKTEFIHKKKKPNRKTKSGKIGQRSRKRTGWKGSQMQKKNFTEDLNWEEQY